MPKHKDTVEKVNDVRAKEPDTDFNNKKRRKNKYKRSDRVCMEFALELARVKLRGKDLERRRCSELVSEGEF